MRTKVMKRLTGTLGVIAILAGSLTVASTAQATPTTHNSSVTTSATLPAGWQNTMLKQLNSARKQAGVPLLTFCAPIVKSAQKYATLMARTGHYGHQGPDGSQAWDRMAREQYNYLSAGENIAQGQRSVRHVMTNWVNSPSHYKNIVDPTFTHVGFGAKKASNGRVSWVQNFGGGGSCTPS
jgi:uncharacterized protein YkwD